MRFSAQTDVDQTQRTVTLSQIAVTDATFPSSTPDDAAKAAAIAKRLLPTAGVVVSLDYLVAALAQSGQTATSVALNTTPPPIFVAEQPSRLLLFDGAPTFATVTGTSVQHAVNTNWPLLREALQAMGRADLIGNGKLHLVPSYQPQTAGAYSSARRKNSTPAAPKPGRVLTQHTGLPPRRSR